MRFKIYVHICSYVCWYFKKAYLALKVATLEKAFHRWPRSGSQSLGSRGFGLTNYRLCQNTCHFRTGTASAVLIDQRTMRSERELIPQRERLFFSLCKRFVCCLAYDPGNLFQRKYVISKYKFVLKTFSIR